MTILPVVARELSVLARRKSTYWSRWVTAVLALVVMLWLLLFSAAQISFARLGGSIFLILSSLCFTFAVLVGMQATADCLSEEKREGTLGLLFLTDLKGRDVIAGKLAVSSLHAVFVLIGVIPMLSMALLLGGVTLRQFGLVALVLVNTMFLSLSLGVFVSSVSKNERKAMVGTFVGLFLIVLGPLILGFFSIRILGFPEMLLAISPLYPFASLHTPMRMPGGPIYFWHSLAGTHLLAWIFLTLSAFILPRCVNELPAVKFRGLRAFADNFVYGRRAQRQQHRAELLDKNAFLWLASRERVKPKYAWGIIAFFVGLYLWIALQFDDMLFDPAISVAIMFLTHLVFKIWLASEVCSRLIQDRRSGALELLLSTPLSVREIGEGQSMALGRIFFKPILVLLAMEAFLLFGGLNGARQWVSSEQRIFIYAAVMITFLADLWALKWVGLWLSLTGKSMERVLLTTLARVLGLPWLLLALAAGLMATSLARGGVDAPGAAFAFLFTSGVSVVFGLSARQKFLGQFRTLASKRYETAVEPEPQKIPKKVSRKNSKWESRVPDVFRQRPVAGSLFLALVLLVLFAWGRREFWNYRVKSLVKEARASGAPVTLSDAARFNPAPPLRENGFAVLANAGPPIWRGGQIIPRTLRVDGREATKEQLSQHIQQQASMLVAANPAQLSALWTLPEYPRAHIDPMGNDLWTAQFNHLGYAAILEADLLTLNAPIGSERAEKSIRALLAQARLLRNQPLASVQHAASETLRRLASRLATVLEKDLLTEEVLSRLQTEIELIDDPSALERTLKLQRAFFLEPPPDPGRPGPWGGGAIRAVPVVSLWNSLMNGLGSEDKRLAQVLAEYNQALDLKVPTRQRMVAAAKFDRQRSERARQSGFGAQAFAGQSFFYGYIPEVFWNDAAFTTQLHLIKTAIAAERYEMRHRRIPMNLDMLVPEFLPAVPADPYDGSKLRAFRRGEDLLIYSVGMDRADDTQTGGAKRSGADIVFTFR